MQFLNTKILYIGSSFLAGFSIMTVELVSTRIVAPIIGTSVYTWTSVIGLTLLGLALGGWVGGKVADAIDTDRPIPVAFFLSALFVALIPKLAEHTDFILTSSHSILTLNVILSLYLFLIPALTIGTIQPLILKKYADTFSRIGSKYGNLSAAWSTGSMLGVFLTGFFFISIIGSKETIWLISFILFVLGSLFAYRQKKLLIVFLISFLVICAFFYATQETKTQQILYSKETTYYNAKVIDATIPLGGASRILLLDFDVHSIESPNSITLSYTDMHPVFSYLKEDLTEILILGAGAYSIPKNVTEYYPDSHVSVVETDPEMINIGNKYFELEKFNIDTIIDDAKLHIRKHTASYDLVFGDTFSSFISVPWYLLTAEWNEEVRKKLNKNGIYAVNMIGSLEGDSSHFTKSVIRTFSLSFPNYYIFAFGENRSNVQNIVILGINGPLPLTETDLREKMEAGKYPHLANMIIPREEVAVNDATILTNNFSPVEKLMDPIITQYFPDYLVWMRSYISNPS